jgi:hypothetical protein
MRVRWTRIRSSLCACIDRWLCDLSVEASGGIFQIRPHRDFVPAKGRDRLLSLRLLSELSFEDVDMKSTSDLSSNSGSINAYEFMRRRREVGSDPALKRWNASIRLSNFASVESSPLCVSVLERSTEQCRLRFAMFPDFLGRSLTGSPNSATSCRRLRRRRSRRSGNSWHWISHTVSTSINLLHFSVFDYIMLQVIKLCR